MCLTPEELKTKLPAQALVQCPEGIPLKKLHSGKVRELFDAGEGRLLMVATDRLSAFDVILPQGIPGKGTLLTQLSLAAFARTQHIVPNHLVGTNAQQHSAALEALLETFPPEIANTLRHRSMLVHALKPIPIEAVVRGYLAGSAWAAYTRSQNPNPITETNIKINITEKAERKRDIERGNEAIHASINVWGHALPAGLEKNGALPQPLFTPTTKAAVGAHDAPVTEAECAAAIGETLFANVKSISLALYAEGARWAAQAELRFADCKFEFGQNAAGKLVLMDEALTPDASRYWPATGSKQPLDKQLVRNYLENETPHWNKQPPGPELPQEILNETLTRYTQLYTALVNAPSAASTGITT